MPCKEKGPALRSVTELFQTLSPNSFFHNTHRCFLIPNTSTCPGDHNGKRHCAHQGRHRSSGPADLFDALLSDTVANRAGRGGVRPRSGARSSHPIRRQRFLGPGPHNCRMALHYRDRRGHCPVHILANNGLDKEMGLTSDPREASRSPGVDREMDKVEIGM